VESPERLTSRYDARGLAPGPGKPAPGTHAGDAQPARAPEIQAVVTMARSNGIRVLDGRFRSRSFSRTREITHVVGRAGTVQRPDVSAARPSDGILGRGDVDGIAVVVAVADVQHKALRAKSERVARELAPVQVATFQC
jgi:hypothetical protein